MISGGLANVNWASVFQMVLAVVTVALVWYGHRISKRGKDKELDQTAKATEVKNALEERRNAFEELESSLTAARADLEYKSKEAADARSEKTRLQTEWVDRWGRQLERCRLLTETLVSVIEVLSKDPANAEAKLKAESVLREVVRHNDSDHPLDKDNEHDSRN